MRMRDLTIKELEAEFEDAAEELFSDSTIRGHDEDLEEDEHLFVDRDGWLRYQHRVPNTDAVFVVWRDGQWKDDRESLEGFIEGWCDGQAALRTTDRGWRDE